MTSQITTEWTARQAYYSGRSSIGDNGEVWYAMPAEIAADPVLATEFKTGIRHIKSELRLNADTEWG